MNIEKKKFLIEVISFLIICLVVSKAITYASIPEVQVTYDASTLNTEQQLMTSRILDRYKKVEPTYLGDVTELGKTLSIYRLYDGSLSDVAPDWYQDGEIILLPTDKDMIAGENLIPAPKWLFWKNEMTIKKYNELSRSYVADIIGGVILGIFVTGMYASRIQIKFGSVKSFILFIIPSLGYGCVYGIIFGAGPGLIIGMVSYLASISYLSLCLGFEKVFIGNTNETAISK